MSTNPKQPKDLRVLSCKNFNGYKPCFSDHNCWENGCKNYIPVGTRILIINLDAMGDVLMTTAQLAGIKRKYPHSTISWVTLKNAVGLLYNNPYIDKVFPFDFESELILSQMKFDIIMNVDKSQRSGALTMKLHAEEKYGFGINDNGKIIPISDSAAYNYLLGLDDNLKFKLNKRTGQDYLAETFNLDYKNDEYVFHFTIEELNFIEEYKKEIGILDNDKIIGFNTGCSLLFPNKKMTLEQHAILIERFLSLKEYKIMLLGGPEDLERNQILAEQFSGKIINTPVNNGVRKGACYESIPQVIITGDSFGMHLAIALKKYVIAWFGLSCWTEIDLYGNGVKLHPEGLFCAPCWKKVCPYNLECIQMIDLERIVNETVSFFTR
jgi:heptosyltransferase-2